MKTGTLNERDRALLRLHVVSGMSIEAVGKVFGVSQPTASCWLAKARKALLAHVLASRLDLSLSELLKER